MFWLVVFLILHSRPGVVSVAAEALTKYIFIQNLSICRLDDQPHAAFFVEWLFSHSPPHERTFTFARCQRAPERARESQREPEIQRETQSNPINLNVSKHSSDGLASSRSLPDTMELMLP